MSWKSKLAWHAVSRYVAPGLIQKNKLPLALAATGLGVALLAKKAAQKYSEYELRGKTVLITGGSRGLGLVLAREFLRAGAWVAICAREVDELQRATNELWAIDSNVLGVPCDVTNPEEVEKMVHLVRDHFGNIDVLVNNAGIINVGPAEVMTFQDYRQSMETNYYAALHTTFAVLPEMRARREGRIINIASIGGKISVPHLLPYSASKFALVGWSKGLRAEIKKDGIVVTTICPGLMRTGSPRNADFKGDHEAEYAWFSVADSLPLISISAENAARQILTACKRGSAEVVLSVPAKAAVKFQALFPTLTSDLMEVVNRFLPAPNSNGMQTMKGKDSETKVSSSWLTELSQTAAMKNNQM